MSTNSIWKETILKECKFKASRSSGPGGQHVNRTESRMELHWSLAESNSFTELEKIRIEHRIKSRLTTKNVLILSSESQRSQLKNKEEIINRFQKIITEALKVPKKRKASKPTRSSVERRIKMKKMRSDIKKNRKLKF